MAIHGVPIGISDGLSEPRRFWLGRCHISGCPGLEKAPGAVEMAPVPSDRNYSFSPACLPQLVPKQLVGLADAPSPSLPRARTPAHWLSLH